MGDDGLMWVKVCGIRDELAAQQVAATRPDAIGLNFFARSVRFVDRPVARRIVAALPTGIERVGVFVNSAAEEIAAIVHEVGLTAIQLHGDETPTRIREIQRQLPSLPLIRAWRVGAEGLDGLSEHWAGCRQLGVQWYACLIDARVEGEYGGTGAVAPWQLLAEEWEARKLPRLILAGGLTPANVVAGIVAARPWGVDVASGVESAPGVKDVALVTSFVDAARGVSAPEDR